MKYKTRQKQARFHQDFRDLQDEFTALKAQFVRCNDTVENHQRIREIEKVVHEISAHIRERQKRWQLLKLEDSINQRQ